ncbi:MAG: D-alanyl-D-alanine carboxypeptidase [Nitrospirae bacterium]|nr:D-alanyl-D-alanine carboxypeptidase [Nitrospirota bacterium]
MKEKLRVTSYELRVISRRLIKDLSHVTCRLLLFLLLVTCHLSLVTVANADEVTARSAIVINASTDEVLFAKNPELRLFPASTVKIMTAIVAVERLDMDEVVTISSKSANQQPSKINLRKGDRVKIRDLLYAALMESANDAATALAEAVTGNEWSFVRLMNKKALEIGAVNTRYINANGLPRKGQYSTAYDLAKTMQYAMTIPDIKEILSTKVKGITINRRKIFLRNTNELLWRGDYIIAGKSGFTRLARHCFVGVANKEDVKLVTAILGSPSRKTLWTESEMLFEKGYRAIKDQKETAVYSAPASKSNVKKVNSVRNSSGALNPVGIILKSNPVQKLL